MILRQRIQEAQNTIATIIGNKKVRIVYRPGYPEANIKENILYIPPLNNDFNEKQLTEFRACVDHEALHIKYTTEKKAKGIIGHLQNALEDSRIEKLGGKEYRGVKRNLTCLNYNIIPKIAEKTKFKSPEKLHEILQTITALQLIAHDPQMIPYNETEILKKFPGAKKWINKLPPEVLNRVRNIEKEKSVKDLSKLICKILAIEHIKLQENENKKVKFDNLSKLKKIFTKSTSKENKNPGTEEIALSESEINELMGRLCPEEEYKKFEKFKKAYVKKIVEKLYSANPYTCNPAYDQYIKIPKHYGNDCLKLIQSKQKEIAYIKSKLLRLSHAYKPTKQRGMRTGKLDNLRIAQIDITDNVCTKQIKQLRPAEEAFCILIDMSGSMKGVMQKARQCVAVIGSVLDQHRKPFEILGWSGKSIGYNRYKDVVRKTQIDHYIFKEFRDSFASRRECLQHLVAKEQNVDGEAVYWAACRLSRRHERKKILIVISDGYPEDGKTEKSALYNHLHKVLKDIEVAGINVIGIGLTQRGIDAVRTFYKNATYVSDPKDLTTNFLNLLNKILLRKK